MLQRPKMAPIKCDICMRRARRPTNENKMTSLSFSTKNTSPHLTMILPLWSAGVAAFASIPTTHRAAQALPSRGLPHSRPVILLQATRLNPELVASDDGTATSHASENSFNQEASKFIVYICSATSCAKKRQQLNLDEYATLSGFWGIRMEANPGTPTDGSEKDEPDKSWMGLIRLEESSCLGSCAFAPCVGIEHDDYEGPVALLGMNSDEFASRTFRNVVDDGDVRRVWSCVSNAVEAMVESNSGEGCHE
jgi:hypothetical protein